MAQLTVLDITIISVVSKTLHYASVEQGGGGAVMTMMGKEVQAKYIVVK